MDPATTQAVAKAAEESAKTAGKALEIVHDAGGYLRSVVADVPADLVGVVGGAWLRERHIRLRDKLRRRTEQILRERDVQEVIELSPNIAAALISGAQEEGREELMELWAPLLGNAMDPKLSSVRHSFIEAVKEMDPTDALVLAELYKRNSAVRRDARDEAKATSIVDLAEAINRRQSDVEVSLRHLLSMRFLDQLQANRDWFINVTAVEFMLCCYPEVAR
jgi:Abortive infection alpha